MMIHHEESVDCPNCDMPTTYTFEIPLSIGTFTWCPVCAYDMRKIEAAIEKLRKDCVGDG